MTGQNFSGAAGHLQVLFGSTPATNVHVVDDSQVTAVVPAGSGTVDVRVQSGVSDPGDRANIKAPVFGYGTSATTASDRFTYGTVISGQPSQLNLVVPGKGDRPRTSDLLPDGGFRFVTVLDAGQPGTACVCDVLISETFEGYLLTGGPFALRPDGGLPLVSALSATLTDRLTDAGAGTDCLCAMPCSATYSVAGAPF